MRISDWSSDVCSSDLDAVERVEIVADGASALYGSDAVAGVANIILRRNFDGARASARWGASTDGGNEIGRASCRERVCKYVYISGVAESLKKKTKQNIDCQ